MMLRAFVRNHGIGAARNRCAGHNGQRSSGCKDRFAFFSEHLPRNRKLDRLILCRARWSAPLVAEVTVVGSPRRYTKLGLHVIADNVQIQSRPGSSGYGPLAGIATALGATRSPWNLILACDMPYLSAEWIDWLLSRAVRSRGKAVVPRTERGLEPLAAVYRRECGAHIAATVARAVRHASDALEELRLEDRHPPERRAND